ncbi:MAG TPA: cytidine deaminase [Kosmotogaceae bacterium]|nr:cytidine deaminase [Kosmotogaceae bacterium]
MDEKTKNILIQKAREALPHAYSHYSGFSVAAALLTSDGEIITGVNVENSSFGLSICAERSAIVAAVAKQKRHFAAIAIVSSSAKPTPPCGACRQFMREFGDFEVILAGDNEEIITSVSELLPLAFLMKGH